MWTQQRTWDAGAWPERTDRPRVLVEDPDGAVLDVSRRALERQGFDVQVCTGPQGMGRRTCPLLHGEGCRLAAGADVVYTALAGSGSVGVDVVRTLHGRYPRTPVVAEVTTLEHVQHLEALEGCQVVHVPCGLAEMTAAVTAALPAPADDF
jgi:CheY-like chemotaxis protein